MKNIYVGETLEITYSYSDDIRDLMNVLGINIIEESDNNSTRNDIEEKLIDIDKFSWTPTSDDVGGIFEFEISNQILTIKVLPDISNIINLHAWYDFTRYGPSQKCNFEDFSENNFQLINGSISGMTELNGNQAGYFDAASKDSVWSNNISNISEPYTVFMVVNRIPDTNWRRIYQLNNDRVEYGSNHTSTDEGWQIYAGDGLHSSSNDDSLKLHTVLHNGSDSWIRHNSEHINSGPIGGKDINVIGLGSREPNESKEYWDGSIGEVIIASGILSTEDIKYIESYLNNKWNLNL